MTLLDTIPTWLRYFRLMVKTEGGTVLFDTWRDDYQLFKFEDQRGGEIGSNIKLLDKPNGSFTLYKIKDIKIYSDMTSYSSDLNKKEFGWQVDLIV